MNLRAWIRGNCKFAADADYSLWNTPKFESAVQLVEAYNNLDNFTSLSTSIKSLVNKVQQTPDIPRNREYTKVMTAMSQLDQLRQQIDAPLRQARQAANQGQDVMPMVSQLQRVAEQVLPLVDQIFASINTMGKRVKSQPRDVTAQAQPTAAPDQWVQKAPMAEAPVAAPQTPAPQAQPPLPAKQPKAKPIKTPDPEPTLFKDVKTPELAYNEIVPLLNTVKQRAQKAAQIQQFDYGGQLNKMQSLFEKGKEGLHWYDNIAGLLKKRLGSQKNVEMFLNFVAATSPRMPVMRNLDQAIQAYNQYMSGQEFSGFMRTHVPNILRAFKGEELSGSKVNNFAKAMAGDANAVTLDVWMARAFGMNKDQFNDVQYKVLSEAIRELAQQAGVEPRQYQAAVWTGIKKEQDSKLTADPIDQLMDAQWGKFKQDFLKYKGKTKPDPAAFQLNYASSLTRWVQANCKFR
jgi:hypothetical protein